MSKNFKIGKINYSKKKFIIVDEAYVNHNGKIKLA